MIFFFSSEDFDISIICSIFVFLFINNEENKSIKNNNKNIINWNRSDPIQIDNKIIIL